MIHLYTIPYGFLAKEFGLICIYAYVNGFCLAQLQANRAILMHDILN